MPTDSYVVEDTWNGKYVSTFTPPSTYAEVLPKAIGLVPIRTEAECDTIIAALNAIDAGRFSKKD